jgi:hypothetical protein
MKRTNLEEIVSVEQLDRRGRGRYSSLPSGMDE